MTNDIGAMPTARAGVPSGLSRSPSQPEALIAIAERCEAAAGPDLKINRDLLIAGFNIPPRGEGFTHSIDAAMTLVPEGWDSCLVGKTDDGRGHAQLAGNDGHMMAGDPAEFYVEADAATPALALCATALRARAAQGIEARSGETVEHGSTEGESPVAKPCARKEQA